MKTKLLKVKKEVKQEFVFDPRTEYGFQSRRKRVAEEEINPGTYHFSIL